jgi:hypothetical protein
MKKFEVYQNDKLKPLIVEAERFDYSFIKETETGKCHNQLLKFCNGDYIVAMFNWNNIAGFKEIN